MLYLKTAFTKNVEKFGILHSDFFGKLVDTYTHAEGLRRSIFCVIFILIQSVGLRRNILLFQERIHFRQNFIRLLLIESEILEIG